MLPYVFESPSELSVEHLKTPEQVDLAILMIEGQIKERARRIERTDLELQEMTENEDQLREGLMQAIEERQAEEADDQAEEFIPLEMGDSCGGEKTNSSLKNLKSQLSETLARQKVLRELEDERSKEETELKTLSSQLEKASDQIHNLKKDKKLRDWFLVIALGLAGSFAAVVGFVNMKN